MTLFGIAAILAGLAVLVTAGVLAFFAYRRAVLEVAEFQHRMLIERRLAQRKVECLICEFGFTCTLPVDYEPGDVCEVECPRCGRKQDVEV